MHVLATIALTAILHASPPPVSIAGERPQASSPGVTTAPSIPQTKAAIRKENGPGVHFDRCIHGARGTRCWMHVVIQQCEGWSRPHNCFEWDGVWGEEARYVGRKVVLREI